MKEELGQLTNDSRKDLEAKIKDQEKELGNMKTEMAKLESYQEPNLTFTSELPLLQIK